MREPVATRAGLHTAGSNPLVAPYPSMQHEHDLWRPTMTDEPVSEESELGDIVELLDDAVIRSILAVTSEEPHSAKELAEYCDVSVSSIYRRVERLEAASLLTEQTRPRADGHHDTVYVARLDRFEVTVENGEIDWTIERESGDIADELSRMWGNF